MRGVVATRFTPRRTSGAFRRETVDRPSDRP